MRSFAFGLAIALTAFAGGAGPAAAAPLDPVSCASLSTLRELGPSLTLFTNPRTGDALEYVVIGDGRVSSEVIVMFNGTKGVLADWPTQLLTNSRASPLIVGTDGYLPQEDGLVSLCHGYRLVLFDYPGVGLSPLNGTVTADQIANDVDAMLTSIGWRYRLSTDQIDVVGWSLGTGQALKFAVLAPDANPARRIRHVVLIATKPGGNTDGFVDGNQAPCVDTIFDFQKNNPDVSDSFKATLDDTSFDLLFPYVGEPPNNGPTIDCTATIDSTNETVTLNVTPNCPNGSECAVNLAVQAANRATSPWSLTKGVSPDLFVQEREIDDDFSLCYCAAHDRQFNSTDCACSGSAPEMSSANGGVCETLSTQPNAPVSTDCVHVATGPITVINGLEDLYIQHTYGKELVTAYRQMFGRNRASLVPYPGPAGAGHGVLLQHPSWTQQQIFEAIRN